MLLSLRVSLTFGQSKVKYLHNILVLWQSNDEIVRLDVPVNEVMRVSIFQAHEHLVSQHEDCFKTELARTEREQFL